MKRILGIISIFLLTLTAQSQQNNKHQGPKRHHQKAVASLNLTEAQKAQIKKLHEEQRIEVRELKKNDQITVKESKAKRKAIHEKYKAQYQAILTPEQKAQLAQRKDKASKKHSIGKHHKNKRNIARHKPIARELNLTDVQKQKIKEIRTGFKTKASTIKKDQNLTKDQKKAQFTQLKKQQKEQMKTVLTKEQEQKLESQLRDRKNKTAK